MSLMFEPLRKYASFSGRARRKEYWLWTLFLMIAYTLLVIWFVAAAGSDAVIAMDSDPAAVSKLPMAAGIPVFLAGLFWLLTFIPSLAVTVRRIHDSGNSGWWILITLTAIGGIVILIFALMDGTPGPNRYGPDPKGRSAPAL